jgi:hypothetical protein
MRKIKDMIVDLIVENNLQFKFFKILQDIKVGELDRDYDESYADGFWDFTYDLGFTCDTKENEIMFEAIYNQLWETAEKVLGDK